MGLVLVTAPSYQPLSLNEAKLFLKVDTTADDPLIESQIRAATEYAELFTQSAFVQRTLDDKRDGAPCGLIVLEKPPVQSITSITYVDSSGDTQTWSSSNYRTDLPSDCHKARIEPAYGVSYPSVRDVINSFTIRQVSGYTATPKSVSSLTSSSTTATATTSAAHGYASGDRVVVAGALQAGYNGTFTATVTGSTTFTYTMPETATTPATGTILTAPAAVPDGIVTAIKMITARMYEARAASVSEVNVTDADRMLWAYRAA